MIHWLEREVGVKIRSGGLTLQRPISSGHQEYDLNQDTWPVGKAVPKLESAVQISGEEGIKPYNGGRRVVIYSLFISQKWYLNWFNTTLCLQVRQHTWTT